MSHSRYNCVAMASRDQLLDAALTALNRQPTATMAEIATAVGSSRATLHRHFSSREALIAEIAVRAVDRWELTQEQAGIREASESTDSAVIRAALDALLRQYALDAADFGIVLTDDFAASVPEMTERGHAIVEREVVFYAQAQRVGVLRSDLPARWIVDVVYGLMVSARESMRWGNVARRDLSDLVVSTFFAGVGR
jgi:AcrR family transcriptional regulator